MYYNARWYAPYNTHFISPDSIIPDHYNPQSWNRYSYVNNNPTNYTDPSGHYACDGLDCSLPSSSYIPDTLPLIQFEGDGWGQDAKDTIGLAAKTMGIKFSKVINSSNRLECIAEGDTSCLPAIFTRDAFRKIFEGSLTFKRVGKTCAEWFNEDYGCWGFAAGSTVITFSNAPNAGIAAQPQWATHEIFHIFDASVTNQAGRAYTGGQRILLNRAGLDIYPWRQSQENETYEAFADSGIAWTFNHWLDSAIGAQASQLMNAFMTKYILHAYNTSP